MTTHATSANPWLVALVVSLATFMELLDTTITNVSIKHIAGSLGAGQDESTWVITSYLVANGIILPLSGWLSDIMGRKRFFIACIIGFTISSFCCGAATSMTELIIFRILQGASGGGLQPTQQAIILDIFPPEKRGLVFGITGITMIAAPIIGPTLGGLITDNVSWRWIFYINVPVGIIAAFFVWRLVDEPDHAKAQKIERIDFFGLGLVSLGLASLQIILDKGQQEDWFNSSFIVFFAVLSFISLLIAIIWLWGQKKPIIDLSLFKQSSFSCACALMFITGFMLFGGTAMIPLLLQNLFGYDATLAGLVISPGGMVVIFLMPVCGNLIGKVQARYMIFLGLFLSSIGMFHTAELNLESDYFTFVWVRVTQVLGLPFLFIALSTLAFSNIPKEKSNKASALFAMFRNIGGSVGIAVTTTLVTRGQQIHQNHLVDHLIEGKPGYEQLYGKVLEHTGDQASAFAYIYGKLQEQITMLAYVDTFRLLGYMMFFTFIVSLFVLPSNKPGAKVEAAEAAH